MNSGSGNRANTLSAQSLMCCSSTNASLDREVKKVCDTILAFIS